MDYMSNSYLKISEASHFLGVSVDTIRRWEKKGLVKARRSECGVRLFCPDELHRLQSKLLNGDHRDFKVLKAKKRTKYSVIELFAGAGGLALGLENSGLNTQLLVEIEKNAANTLKVNRPEWNVVNKNIEEVDFSNYKNKVDIVAGGFPCQAFSYAGKRMGFEDARGTLFFEYARAIKEINPKLILAENVRGLEKHDGGRTLKTMLSILNELGYFTSYKILKAQYYDVAQKRERLVIIGTRKDLKMDIYFPKENDYTIGLRSALKDVPFSLGQKYTEKKLSVMKLIPEGGYWRNLPDEIQKSYMGASYYLGGGKTGMARRLAWDEPSLTLTCNPAQKQTERCHPSEDRPLTIREYARIQSFPDSWSFSGSISNQYKQIGNAVPVNLAYHIGRCLAAIIDRLPDDTMNIVPFTLNME